MDIYLKNLSYTYQPHSPFEQKVLHDVNLTIREGQWVAIVGRTGSGKSTLIQQMNGLLQPTSGSVQLGHTLLTSKRRKKQPPLFQDVGMVFQYPEHQLFEESVAKDIAFGPKNLGWPEELIERRVYSIIEKVGLDQSFLGRSPFELSGGEKRRVAIAGVLVTQPQVLILDEPTAGLDPAGKALIMKVIEEWQREGKRTVIMITHQMDDVFQYVDEVIVLSAGMITFQKDPLTLFTQHRRELEEMGLGVPKMIQFVDQLNKKLVEPITITSAKRDIILKQIVDHFKRQGV